MHSIAFCTAFGLRTMSSEIDCLKLIENSDSACAETCACQQCDSHVAYETMGVLKCSKQDCMFFIENFLDSIISQYTSSVQNPDINS